MAFKLLFLLFTGVASAATLRTNDSQQFLNARAPRNYILNSGAEKNDLSVTDASAIHTRTTSTPLVGDGSHAIDATATAQTVVFLGTAFQPGVQGGACELRFNYSGDASLYRAYATLNGVAVSDPVNNQLVNVASGSQTFSAVFPCGVSSSHVASVVIESTGNGAAIKVDGVYVGEATGIGSVAQAEACLYASRLTSDQTISSTAATTLIYNNVITGTSCGTFDTGTGVFTVQKAGRYQITPRALLGNVTTENVALTVLAGGTSYTIDNHDPSVRPVMGEGNGVTVNLVAGQTIAIQSDSTADASYTLFADGRSNLDITRFPTASETIARLDAPFVGPTSIAIQLQGSSNSVQYTGQTTTSFAVCNGNGTATFWGNTILSGALGGGTGYFKYTLPSPWEIDTTKLGATAAGDQALGAASIRDTGTTFYRAIIRYNSSNSIQILGGDVGNEVTSSSPMSWTTGDTLGFQFTVPVTASSPCAKSPQVLIPGSVYSSSAGVERVERVIFGGAASGGVPTSICSASPCVVASQSGAVSSVTRASTGAYSINFTPGTFSAVPTCTIATGWPSIISAGQAGISGTMNANVVSIASHVTTGAVQDSVVSLVCMGPR